MTQSGQGGLLISQGAGRQLMHAQHGRLATGCTELNHCLIRDVPPLPPSQEKRFVLTYVVLGQTVAHLSNVFLTHKEKGKIKEAKEKQLRKSQLFFTSSGHLHLKMTKCTLCGPL